MRNRFTSATDASGCDKKRSIRFNVSKDRPCRLIIRKGLDRAFPCCDGDSIVWQFNRHELRVVRGERCRKRHRVGESKKILAAHLFTQVSSCERSDHGGPGRGDTEGGAESAGP